MTTQPAFKYFAFISYNSKDQEWGRRLQRKLEGYRMPSTLCSEHGWKRRPLNPVFFAPTDIQPGGLSVELQERLRQSRHLIVICSPASAQSEWVGKEIAFFHSLGRTDGIQFFIVDGQPHSGNPETECFNPVIEELGMPEILGANINERIYHWKWLNRERAYVQLITKLMGVEFDSLWQRHRKRLVMQLSTTLLLLLMVAATIFFTWKSSQPFDATFRLYEEEPVNDELPVPGPATVELYLDNETKQMSVSAFYKEALASNVPSRFLGQEVRLTVQCADFLALDTTIVLKRHQRIALHRDEQTYGNIQFTLWDYQASKPVPGVQLSVAGIAVTSDEEGRVRLSIPLTQQRTSYPLTSEVALEDSIVDARTTESTIVLISR